MAFQIQELSNNFNSESCPVPKSKIDAILSQSLLGPNPLNINETITILLETLRKSSSLHKFLIPITNIQSSKDIDIKQTLGSVWNDKKDGNLNYKLSDNNQEIWMISIIWITLESF